MTSVSFTLRQLEYFDAVASAGTLAAAAERCRVSPSALTVALDELERHLGVQLLVRRKGRGVVLTATGARLLRHARSVLADAEVLADDASRSGAELSGRLSFGCFTTLTPFFVPPIVQGFRDEYPLVSLDVVEGSMADLQEMLLQGRIDVALLYAVDTAHALVFETVREYRPHVIVGTEHRLADRTSVSLRELVDEPLIEVDVPPTRHNTHALFSDFGLRPRIGQVTTSYETARCLVGYGLGYAVLFQRPGTSLTYGGHEVVELELDDPVPLTAVGLARPDGAPRTARYDALRRLLSVGEFAMSAADG